MLKYLSDTHFDHTNIIRYCQRPFATTVEMNRFLLAQLHDALTPLDTLVHAGDVAFGDVGRFLAAHPRPAGRDHLLILGNHDRGKGHDYRYWFSQVIGARKAWLTNGLILEDTVDDRRVAVLVSHAPQDDLRGCDFNVHGHVHNNEPRARSAQHLNACVEVVGYRPRSLLELIQLRQRR